MSENFFADLILWQFFLVLQVTSTRRYLPIVACYARCLHATAEKPDSMISTSTTACKGTSHNPVSLGRLTGQTTYFPRLRSVSNYLIIVSLWSSVLNLKYCVFGSRQACLLPWFTSCSILNYIKS